MSLETSLLESSRGLASERATERRKAAENLKTFLSGNAAPCLLTENSQKKRGYSWDDLFNDVHEYILKEIEKFDTSKSFENAVKPLATSLLHMTVTGSKKGKSFVKCDRITTACLYILKSHRMSTAIGDAYINLLYKYVIPCEFYMGYISPKTWEELLDVSISVCSSDVSALDNFTKLRLVWLLVKHGSSSCQFINPLRDSLPRLQKLFLVSTADKKVQEVIIDVLLLLLESLSSDYRLAMCKLTETIFGTMITFYNQNFDKKKSSLFKLFHMIVLLHHPQGRLQNEQGSLAYSWNKWNRHLNSVLELIYLEVKVLQKTTDSKFRVKDDITKDSEQLFSLAAAVLYQVFNMPPVQPVEDDAASSSKRQKVAFNKNKTFADLIDELRQNHSLWLGITTTYIKNCGDKVSAGDSLSLLHILDNYVTSNNSGLHWGMFEELVGLTLRNLCARTDCKLAEIDGDRVLLSLWNSCVRHSTLSNLVHKAMHGVLQSLLMCQVINYKNVQPLVKLYQDTAMPVTDYSVKTLCLILSIFFTKYNDPTDKLKCFQWFMSADITCTDMTGLQDLFLRLISNQNVDVQAVRKPAACDDTLHEILFNTVDKCILFSEFELDLQQPQLVKNDCARKYEAHTIVQAQIQKVLEETLMKQRENAKRCETKLVEYSKHIRLVLNYFDMLIKYTDQDLNEIKNSKLYNLLRPSLRYLLASLTALLSKGKESSDQTALLHNVQAILSASYNQVLSTDVRSMIDHVFFICVHDVINRTVEKKEDDDMEVDSYPADMRGKCICLLAAYCKVNANHREEILDLILDYKLYNFQILSDIECAFQCMKTLIDATAETSPLERIFGLMQNMCKVLFRNTKAICGLLKILLTMLDMLWSHASATMRGNCLIMVTGLLQRCEKQYYPPHVAALIYECVARIEQLNRDQSQRSSFKESLLAATKCDMHSVRLYCCYLMKYVAADYEPANIETHLSGMFEFFLIDVNDKTEQMLSDELANRTLTVLHEFVALAQTKSTLTNNVVAAALKVQKEKSLDKNLVKKVLNKIANLISLNGIDEYLSRNILALSHSWFSANYKLADLPVYLLGLSTTAFLKAHLKWVVPAEILWAKEGKIENSDILFQITNNTNTSVEDVIESCFCTIIVLCLPYVVAEKYNLHYRNQLKQLTYDQRTKNADTMFQLTRQVLGNEKWSYLYVENMGELVLLTALHLADCKVAKEVFGLDIPQPTESFYYPIEVFNAVLRYYGELITEDIMQYLSENQPMVISKVILKLWESVLQKTIIEYKALSLSSYLKFIENVPMGFNSDHFVCNFSCSSLLHAAKASTDKRELKLYLTSLDILLRRFLPQKGNILRETLPIVLSVLTIKKDEGFAAECNDLLEYLASSDQVDGMNILSQSSNRLTCTSMKEFKETLTTFMTSMKCPSFEVLCNFKKTLKANKLLINKLCKDLNLKGFSEDCKTSLLHQVTNILNNILVSESDNKTILEACDCLSTIGTYDLKTLVMIAPPDSRHVTGMKPSQYFAIVVLKCLSQLLSDENPVVASKVMVTLARLLKYQEGKIAFDLGEVDQQILRQFLPANSSFVQAKFQLNPAKFDAYAHSECWIPAESEDHEKWIARLTTLLLDVLASGDNYLSSLGVVCKSKPSLCRGILPSLIGVALHVGEEHHVTVFADQINCLLHHFWDKTYQESGSYSADSPSRRTNELGHEHKLIIQDLLNVVNFVRLQRSHYNKRYEENESLNYLRLEYDKVAWAAAISDNSLAALYYGELCASARNGGAPPRAPELTADLPGGEQIQSIFRKCFTSIGELDAIDGCGGGHLTSEEEKRRHLMNTRQYSDALLEHDIAMSSDSEAQCDASLQCGVVRSLHKSGMHHLALQYIKSLPENDKLDDVKYECLSFLGDWSVFVDTNETENKLKTPNVDIHSVLKEFRYACLKDCLTTAGTAHGFEEKLIVPLSKAKLAVSKLCQKLNMDNCQSVYTAVSQLQMFNDIEEYYSVRSGKLPLCQLLDRWQVETLAPFHDFRHTEALISQRSLILEHAAKQNCSSLNVIVELQLNYTELALSNQRIPLSQRLLAMAKKGHVTGELSMVEGQISWAKGHKDISLSLIRDVMCTDTTEVTLSAAALRQYGLWMAESKCESARDIIDKYLQRSLEVLGEGDGGGIKLKLYYDIAMFADAEYKQVVAYMKSPIFENKVKCMESMKDAASSLRSTQNKALSKDEFHELNKAIVTNEKMSNLDEAEITSTMAEKKRFLDLAMRYYLLSLINCEENNLSVFRVISLWLDNPAFRFDESSPSSSPGFEELLRAVPARKFVPVLPQLAPRLSDGEDAFNHNLKMILNKCATEHPHHTLPILFSLKNSDKDLRILNAAASVRGAGQGGAAAGGAGREAAAAALLAALAARGATEQRRLEQADRLCDAIISFANYTSKTKDSRQEVPKSEPIRKLTNLYEIPIPTITLPIRHDCDYTYFPAIVSFADSFELVGGLHCPKKMTCKGSDGKQRTLLIKGEDDLRQDAVMQQVFNIVNTLLELNPVTSRNKLLIRTYKVVPLSRRSGVLEWCEGTTPIGSYLSTGGGGGGGRGVGAHARYRPMDISCNAARAKLSTLHKEGRSKADKLRAFLKILRDFKPVFHHFFTEHFLDPATWYERRLAYTKSVATSSMIGYIMGLGDRHVQNILIDKNTAEVIHIDFGIAFDQAKILPTPETIPFRLTQDIVAGFGCCGVEGVFRRSCEKTMQLLRDNHEVLLTILEVLLCDPLYSWAITQAEANRKQNVTAAADTSLIAQNNGAGGGGGGGGGGGLAERTLLAVGCKLSGTEGGAAGGVAVGGQIARLLRAAADPANLSVLYPGWQPYL